MKSLACRLCPPGAKKIAMTRGLCHKCYNAMLVEVKAGRATWKELAARDLCHLTPEEMGMRRSVLFGRRYLPHEIHVEEARDK